MAKQRRGERPNFMIMLTIISAIYIIFFADLNYFYDWDTLSFAIGLKNNGPTFSPAGCSVHLLVPILSSTLVYFGLEPLSALRVFTALFMLAFVLGAYRLTYDETRDDSLAVLMGLFILFNFGYTFLVMSLEDNIWMYGLLMPFAIFLLRKRWILSALFLSFSILVHIQAEVFIPMFLGYIILELHLLDFLRGGGRLIEGLRELISAPQMRTFASALVALFTPLFVVYGYLVFVKGCTLKELITLFTASQPFLHGDESLLYFTSGNSIIDQIRFAYFGYLSTFIFSFPGSRGMISSFLYRYPDYVPSIYLAALFGEILAFLIIYLLVKSFKPNFKTWCSIPTFLVLLFHAVIYESWCVERWDFMPFFIMYFIAVGYGAQTDRIKERLKLVLTALVVLSFAFTSIGFYAITGFQESSLCAYSDELGDLLDDRSVALDITIPSRHSYGRHLTYNCGDKIIFHAEQATNLSETFQKNTVYTSYESYQHLQQSNPKVTIEANTTWSNEIDNDFSILRLSVGDNAMDWNNKGLALANQGKYEEAIQAYDEAIRCDPEYISPWNNKGLALKNQGNLTGAIQAYNKAIRLDPTNAMAWYNKGLALGMWGMYDEVIQAYDEAVGLDPKNAIDWYNNKGVALESLGRTSESDAAYARAMELGSMIWWRMAFYGRIPSHQRLLVF